jgi:hypothetical protein
VIVIHGALLVAVQAQSEPVLTVTVPAAASGEVRVTKNGAIVNAQGAPGCVMVKILPPIVSEPVRVALPVFAATLYATFPLPVPVAPTLTVIHGSLLTAVQLHPVVAVTATFPLAPIEAANVDEVGEIADTHEAAASVTVKV